MRPTWLIAALLLGPLALGRGAAVGTGEAAMGGPNEAASGTRRPARRDDYPRRIGIDIEGYRFELTLSDDTDAIVGRATISVRFTNNGVTELALDLTGGEAEGAGAGAAGAGRGAAGAGGATGSGGRAAAEPGMEVTAVTAGGRPLAHRHEEDLLTIALPEPGRAGERASVTVSYRGVPSGGLRIGPNKYGERTFFSDNWPNHARDWLPTIDHVYDKATCEFVVTAPAHYQVVSNGLLVEETDVGRGTRLTRWRQSVPIAPWLYVIGVARFAVQHLEPFRGKPVQTWVYARDRDAGFHDFAMPTHRALAFFADHVGPFAYGKLANVTSPATGGGMEAATALMYNESAVTGQRSPRWRNVIVHEVAHQWFGNAVTESDWDDVWLSEGFATYFTLLFVEHAYGRDEFVAGLRSAAERVHAWYSEHPDYRVVHDDLGDMSRVTSVATYQKGAWVLHMLRRRVGEEAFWAGVRAYYATHVNGTVTTEDFRRAMEEASGADLEAFFHQWLYSGGVPRLEGWWDYDPTARAVRIEINQTQEAGPTFELPLEVGIHFEGGAPAAVVETLDVDARFHRFVLPVEREPVDVRLDPDTWALFEADFGPRRR